jgi:hypothetical protein
MESKWGTFLLKVLHGMLRRAYQHVAPGDDDDAVVVAAKQQWFDVLDRFPRLDDVARYTLAFLLNEHYAADVEFTVPKAAMANFMPVFDEFVEAFHASSVPYWTLPMTAKLHHLAKLLRGAFRAVVVPQVRLAVQEPAVDTPDPDAECPPFREIDLDADHPVSGAHRPAPDSPATPSPRPASQPAPDSPATPSPRRASKPAPDSPATPSPRRASKPAPDSPATWSRPASKCKPKLATASDKSDGEFVPEGADLSQFSAAR